MISWPFSTLSFPLLQIHTFTCAHTHIDAAPLTPVPAGVLCSHGPSLVVFLQHLCKGICPHLQYSVLQQFRTRGAPKRHPCPCSYLLMISKGAKIRDYVSIFLWSSSTETKVTLPNRWQNIKAEVKSGILWIR